MCVKGKRLLENELRSNEGNSRAYQLVSCHRLASSKETSSLEQHGQQMGTLGGTRLSMCMKPQQTAEMNALHSCIHQTIEALKSLLIQIYSSVSPMDGTFQIMCDGSGNFSSTFSSQGRHARMH